MDLLPAGVRSWRGQKRVPGSVPDRVQPGYRRVSMLLFRKKIYLQKVAERMKNPL